MKKEELKIQLQKYGVDEWLYNLDENGRNDERYCLTRKVQKWNVYFSERGIKTTDELFESEDEACQFIYNRLTNK